MMLFAYVISVFVVHGIERESSVIGALYALGVKRKDLMLHYLTLPVCVTTVAGLIGFGIGISPVSYTHLPKQLFHSKDQLLDSLLCEQLLPLQGTYQLLNILLQSLLLSLIHICNDLAISDNDTADWHFF